MATLPTPGADRFAGQDCSPGQGDVPLLPDYAARFQCKTTHMYEGGDHLIFVGEVLDYAKTSDVRNIVQRFIKRTDPGIPDFWQAGSNGSGQVGVFPSHFCTYNA